MKHILVTGANGQLGSEIKQITQKHNYYNFIFTDIEELNICKSSEIKTFFNIHTYDLIINCAAYTNVEKAETEKDKANLINVDALKNLVSITKKYNSKLIHISTDYVFNGNNSTPYKEDDPTNPQSVYGQTKLDGEKIILQSGIQAIIIRTSWLYSSFGNNFVKTMLRLGKEKNEINVVNDQVGTPTYAADLANAILNIMTNKKFIPGIFHYSNEGVCSWYDFALEIMDIAKLNCIINPIESKDYPSLVKRPQYSILNKSKIKTVYNISTPHWKDGLKRCIEKIK